MVCSSWGQNVGGRGVVCSCYFTLFSLHCLHPISKKSSLARQWLGRHSSQEAILGTRLRSLGIGVIIIFRGRFLGTEPWVPVDTRAVEGHHGRDAARESFVVVAHVELEAKPDRP